MRSGFMSGSARDLAFQVVFFAVARTIAVGTIAVGAVAADASDGRIELNQTCATSGGCVPGDAEGFPISLTAGGSYVLTSNLTVPDQNTHGIQIEANDVTIDFNGFTLAGPATVPIATHVCTLPGTGSGVFKPAPANGSGLTLQNGHIRGMGAYGVQVDAALARLDGMVLERNCASGAFLGLGAFVVDTQVRANAAKGIEVGSGSRIVDCVVDNNGEDGIRGGGSSIVTGTVVTTNVDSGIVNAAVSIGNAAVGNGIAGIGTKLAVQNYVEGNGSLGISASSSGLNASDATGNGSISAAHRVGCDYDGESLTTICPSP